MAQQIYLFLTENISFSHSGEPGKFPSANPAVVLDINLYITLFMLAGGVHLHGASFFSRQFDLPVHMHVYKYM